MNDMIVENELVRTPFISEVTPKVSRICTETPYQKEQMKILAAIHAELNAIVTEQKILIELTRNIPAAICQAYKWKVPGIFWKDKKRIGSIVVIFLTEER